VEPPADRALPPPAEDFHQSWSAGSDSAPVTEYPPYEPPQVSINPPPSGQRFRRPGPRCGAPTC
jgi:hypothetical protein